MKIHKLAYRIQIYGYKKCLSYFSGSLPGTENDKLNKIKLNLNYKLMSGANL